MKKLFFILTLLLISLGSAMAQKNDKPTVCIDEFSYNTRIGSNWVTVLRSNVAKGLLQTGRLNVVDIRDMSEPADVESDFLKGLYDDNIDVLVKGHFNSLVCKSQRYDGVQMYEAGVDYTLTLVDTYTGNTIASHTFQGTSSVGKTEAESISKSLENATVIRMKKLVEDNFKVEALIKELDEIDPKKGAKTVYVTLGANDGIQAGQTFDVYQEIEVAGEVGSRLIGTAKAKEVLGGGITLCTISKGGIEIKNAFDKEQKLIVVTRAKKGLLGDI